MLGTVTNARTGESQLCVRAELCVNLGKITPELSLERHRNKGGKRAGSQQRPAMLVKRSGLLRTLRNEAGLEGRRRSGKPSVEF